MRILSGERDIGKTCFLEIYFAFERNADGFTSRKVYDGETHIGYDLYHLREKKTCPFIRKLDYIPTGWHEETRIADHFSFSKDGFSFAQSIADKAIKDRREWFYLDEIGPLEIAGKGFYSMFKRLLTVKDLHFFIITRSGLVKKLMRLFSITDCGVYGIKTTTTPLDTKSFKKGLNCVLDRFYDAGLIDEDFYNRSKCE